MMLRCSSSKAASSLTGQSLSSNHTVASPAVGPRADPPDDGPE